MSREILNPVLMGLAFAIAYVLLYGWIDRGE